MQGTQGREKSVPFDSLCAREGVPHHEVFLCGTLKKVSPERVVVIYRSTCMQTWIIYDSGHAQC